MTTVSSRGPGNPSASLPPPSADEAALSHALMRHIREEIDAHDTIPFARFMEMALYAPGLGYYSAGKHKIGAAGDFITAPEMGSMFARSLARQCAQIIDQLGTADIFEAGAGSGALAADLLLALEQLGRPPENYFILEVSADLRERQVHTLKQRAPLWIEHVQWLDALPAHGFRGVVIGNELLDAMPVTRIRVGDKAEEELFVGWDRDRFVWRPQPAREFVRERIDSLALPHEYGYVSEINFHAEAWVKSVADVIDKGVILLIDYGFPRAEFYHPQRREGTLMCHYRHRAHGDPFIFVGLQDITAHVDFTAIAEAGVAAGLDVRGYTSQAAFLLGCGLEQLMAESDPHAGREHLKLTQEIHKLTSPSEMGELYKVIALERGVATPLMGFALRDRRVRL
jgi:SAM-dependent MidA family methyltransferase